MRDTRFQQVQGERTRGKKRKAEVALRRRNVGSTEDRVLKLGRNVKEDHAGGLPTAVQKLHEKGRFDGVLTLAEGSDYWDGGRPHSSVLPLGNPELEEGREHEHRHSQRLPRTEPVEEGREHPQSRRLRRVQPEVSDQRQSQRLPKKRPAEEGSDHRQSQRLRRIPPVIVQQPSEVIIDHRQSHRLRRSPPAIVQQPSEDISDHRQSQPLRRFMPATVLEQPEEGSDYPRSRQSRTIRRG